jgi:hypothetical protein
LYDLSLQACRLRRFPVTPPLISSLSVWKPRRRSGQAPESAAVIIRRSWEETTNGFSFRCADVKHQGSVFEPMTELFRWIAVIVILAIVVLVPLWAGITIIRWMWDHPLW